VQSDDTSVAIVEKNTQKSSAQIHFLENVTADLNAYRGVHPILALESHQESLAKLVNKALSHLPVASGDTTTAHGTISLTNCSQPRRKPDFISVTRGPGMRANLFVGLDTGKALSVAWQIPFVGVHHMQAHLLTPRLVSALSHNQDNTPTTTPSPITPEFPFLSILVSGGHSILVKSASITEHEVMASSADIAIGESLDKSAREILPDDLLANAKNTMYGKILEQFAFRNGPIDYADYQPPKKRGDEVVKRETPWGWSLTTPFANTRHLQFSFSSIASAVTKIVAQKQKAGETLSHDERVDLARESMRVCFEHLASRTVIALEALRAQPESQEIKTLVVSGGVAANRFLMTVLRSFLDVRGFGHVDIVAPPPYLCTDNAAMIGWAGIEMFEAGWRTDLGIRALRKWSLDPQADDGGVLGPNGWQRV
jgi:N6-L-threonylcarbamoyladenine synthase